MGNFKRASEYDKKIRKPILEKLRKLYINNKLNIEDLEEMTENNRITLAESIFATMDDKGNILKRN